MIISFRDIRKNSIAIAAVIRRCRQPSFNDVGHMAVPVHTFFAVLFSRQVAWFSYSYIFIHIRVLYKILRLGCTAVCLLRRCFLSYLSASAAFGAGAPAILTIGTVDIAGVFCRRT